MPSPRKAPVRYDAMTREQLVAQLRTLEAGSGQDADVTQALIRDLAAHQLELELQNREMRQAQEAMEESRQKLADLYDFAPVVYLAMNERTQILEANLTASALFGIERKRLVGQFLTSLVVAADRRALRDHVRRCVSATVRAETEITFSVRNQPPVIAQVTSVPLFAASGKVAGCKTTIVDVSAFKLAQAKLKFLAEASATLASSFDYRATLAQVARDAVPILADICIVDLVDRGELRRLEIAYADREKAERFAWLRDAVPRRDVRTAVGRVMRTGEPLLFSDCSPATLASTEEGFDHEALVKASGAQSMMVVPMVVREAVVGAITLIGAESGRRYSGTSLATARDLATHAALAIDNARLYERAQEAIRSREDVLSFVSHDLRNPLMGIQLTAEMLLRSARGEDERRKGWKQLERIRRGVVQMRRMIDDLLDLAGLESGKLTIDIVPHEVKKLFDETAELFAPLVEEKGIALSVLVPAERIDVRCDPSRAVQVLSNLIGNSIKFTPAGGSITLSAEVAGTHALVSVTDTGPGIPPVVRPHIFERFWSADETARKGRGLGLYIAKGLVEALGGAIWVDSPAGGGTTFSFTLPLASAAEVDSFTATAETERGPFVGRG